MDTNSAGRLVWDLPVRVVHWAVMSAVLGCYVSDKLGPSYFTWHLVCGCTVLVLVTFRILWGFVGTRHARFSSFLRGPRAMWAYLQGQPPTDGTLHPVGHNPLGGAGIMIMLALLLTPAVTGLFANDEIENTGPFFGWVSGHTSNELSSIHHLAFLLLKVMIGLHVAAVLFYSLVKREQLIGPMYSGRKAAARVPVSQAISSSKIWTALAILAVLTALLVYLVNAAPPAALSPF